VGGEAVGEAAGGEIFRGESHVGEQAGEADREGPRPDAEANGGVRASELREARAGAGGDATTAEIRLATRPDPDAAGEVDAGRQGSKGGGVDLLRKAATGGGAARTTGPKRRKHSRRRHYCRARLACPMRICPRGLEARCSGLLPILLNRNFEL